jgi:hypothetical protein
MKLTPEKAATLTEVLKAMANPKEHGIKDKDAYKAKKAEVIDCINTDEKGVPTGGIKAEVWKDNQDNKELVAAAKDHLAAAKERAKNPKPATAEKPAGAEDKQRTPEEEKESAECIVAYMNAVSGKSPRIEDAAQYKHVRAKAINYIDPEKGGLKSKHWDRFKGFPGVEEACKAHRAYIKTRPKKVEGPQM